MALSKEVRRIAIVGTGAIGASWAAFYLARGFDVIATDPDSGAEASVRHYIDTAWQALKVLGISPKGSPEHLCFLLRKEVVGHAAHRLEAALYREIASLISQGVLDVADADAAVCWGPDCAGGSWVRICCFIWARHGAGYTTSWST